MEQAKIMVVEDEVIFGKDIQMSLRTLNYDVPNLVTSGETAVEMAEKEDPDLVLMDIVLRGQMDGIEAARQIKSRFDIPVIYLTPTRTKKPCTVPRQQNPTATFSNPLITGNCAAPLKWPSTKSSLRKKSSGVKTVTERTSSLRPT